MIDVLDTQAWEVSPPKNLKQPFFVLSRNGEEQYVTKQKWLHQRLPQTPMEIGQRSHFRTEEAKFIPNFYQVEDLGKKMGWKGNNWFPTK